MRVHDGHGGVERLLQQGLSLGSHGKQLFGRQHHQAREFDAQSAFALQIFQFLIYPLPRCTQQLREILLCELQTDTGFLTVSDAVGSRKQEKLLGLVKQADGC